MKKITIEIPEALATVLQEGNNKKGKFLTEEEVYSAALAGFAMITMPMNLIAESAKDPEYDKWTNALASKIDQSKPHDSKQ